MRDSIRNHVVCIAFPAILLFTGICVVATSEELQSWDFEARVLLEVSWVVIVFAFVRIHQLGTQAAKLKARLDAMSGNQPHSEPKD
jgi:hypothetical protein